MNQRSLVLVPLTTNGVNTTAGFTTHAPVDLNQDNVTTNAWTFANIGRREMKLMVTVAPGTTGLGALTSFTAMIQSCTTGAAAGTWSTITSSQIALTTYGYGVSHFVSNDRYVRLHTSVGGATTAYTYVSAGVLEEQRGS